MLIENLFEKDIYRPINGVVKAHQMDDSSVWQELDEFVITKELDRHLRKFLSAYLATIDNPTDSAVTSKMGVWISGFFGSGKSHFLKVLSYLLRNAEHSYEGQTKRAIEFFEPKIHDAMLLGDLKRAVAADTEVILFNIDSKADARAGREAVLAVFLKVLNEMQGYDGDHPHIAHMERYLDGEGKLAEFHAAYRMATGAQWIDERDAYEFNQDQVIEALSSTLGQSEASVTKWIDNAESNFSLTVENFCGWVRDYLDSQGPKHRLIFLVDEIGQFIGTDGHLMLNLQTIAEDLGTVCEGRAWIVVTSQEEIDRIIGHLQSAAKNDFSKIQARFQTRLSLSSANVDEVIQARLLAKRDDVKDDLTELFAEKGDVLKNQLTFTDCGMTLKPYRDADEFIANYPFAPYQFQLLQKVFEVIRRVGATGLHLSRGERSILDAFQFAGKSVATQQVGVLVPLYEFYPSIESFLDTVVKRTIDQAAENPSLEPFDIKLLQVLFLVRYVEEMKSTVSNLVTLCLNEIDADRLALRRQIEASLGRLEKETLVSRSGDVYVFLTNEERDISREIKSTEISSADEAKLLGELIYEDVLSGKRKHRYPPNNMDFSLSRICDLHPIGGKMDGDLTVSVVSPLADDYDAYGDAKCIMTSAGEHGQVLVRLRDDDRLARELRAYAQTAKYLRTKSDLGLPESSRRILRDNAEENRERRVLLTTLLGGMLAEADYFVAGQKVTSKASTPSMIMEESAEYLVTNTFSKMSYLKYLHPNPMQEVQAILRSNDVAQIELDMEVDEGNAQALDELLSYVDLCATVSRQIVLYDMLENRFAKRPYGWPPEQVLVLLARMIVLGEIRLVMDGSPIPTQRVYEAVSTPAKWRKITVLKRHTADPEAIQSARKLGKEVFSEMGPDGEDALFAFLAGRLRQWQTALVSYRSLAETGDYPGADEIRTGLTLISALLAADESMRFIERFNDRQEELIDLSGDYHELTQFYEQQKPTWDRLRSAYGRFGQNRLELDHDEGAGPALRTMGEILADAQPYGRIKDTDGLIRAVDEVNSVLVATSRSTALAAIDDYAQRITRELDSIDADDDLRTACLGPFEELRIRVANQESLAHIAQSQSQAEFLFESATRRTEDAATKGAPSGGDDTPPSIKPHSVISPADLLNGRYLETESDIDDFISTLRQELNAVIASGKRIRIK